MMAKEPGPGEFGLRPVSLDLSFEETFGIRYPDAYERLVIEVLRGNQALFMRRDEVERLGAGAMASSKAGRNPISRSRPMWLAPGGQPRHP